MASRRTALAAAVALAASGRADPRVFAAAAAGGQAPTTLHPGFPLPTQPTSGLDQTPAATPPTTAPPGLTPPSQLPSKNGALPDAGNYSNKFKLISGGRYGQKGGKIYITDHVIFEYRGYRVSCDRAVGDRTTRVFDIEGNAKLIGQDEIVKGKRIVVDYPKRAYQAFDSEADLRPHLVGGGLKGDVYVKAAESHGTQNETFSRDGWVTTCNLDYPHFDLEADSIDVRAGIRAIFRRARLQIFGKTVASLPYLVIPLDEPTYKNLPVFGQDPQEGYYVKWRYDIPVADNRDVLSHIDLMSKLGVGLGGDYRYRERLMDGVTSLYTIEGSWKELTIANQHNETFSFGKLSLTDNYSQNDYLTGPGLTTFNARGLLSMPQGTRANTQLSFTDATTDGQGFTSQNETVGLTDDRKFSPSFHTNVALNYSNSDSASEGSPGTDREELDVHLQANEELKPATLGLEFLRDIPVGSATNFFSGGDEAPVLSLSSDAQRLAGTKFATVLPFKTSLSWGEFGTGIPSASDIGRGEFDLSFQKPDLSKNRFTVNYNGEFKQDIYSDDTAQYILNFGTDLKYKLSSDTAADLRYSYDRPYGYSPLAIDETGITNLVSFDVNTHPFDHFTTGLQTGYDIARLQAGSEPWQQVGLRADYTLGNYFSLRGLSTYDPFQDAWSNAEVDLTYRPGATLFSVGSNFDGVRHTWTSLNIKLIALKVGRTQLSTILVYNGFTHTFDSQQYNMVYDLHCAEAVFSMTDQNFGFMPGRQYQFFIRLKAFPFSNNFGLGTRGQAIGSTVSQGY